MWDTAEVIPIHKLTDSHPEVQGHRYPLGASPSVAGGAPEAPGLGLSTPAPRGERGALSSGVDVSGQCRLRASGAGGGGVCPDPRGGRTVPVLTYQAANS